MRVDERALTPTLEWSVTLLYITDMILIFRSKNSLKVRKLFLEIWKKVGDFVRALSNFVKRVRGFRGLRAFAQLRESSRLTLQLRSEDAFKLPLWEFTLFQGCYFYHQQPINQKVKVPSIISRNTRRKEAYSSLTHSHNLEYR
jgi:hypothetical protein